MAMPQPAGQDQKKTLQAVAYAVGTVVGTVCNLAKTEIQSCHGIDQLFKRFILELQGHGVNAGPLKPGLPHTVNPSVMCLDRMVGITPDFPLIRLWTPHRVHGLTQQPQDGDQRQR